MLSERDKTFLGGPVLCPLGETNDIIEFTEVHIYDRDRTIEFPFVIVEIQTFLEPVFDAKMDEVEWKKQWGSKSSLWTV